MKHEPSKDDSCFVLSIRSKFFQHRIRDELKAMGVEVTDVPGGASWKRI